MDTPQDKCNAPIWGTFVHSIVGYCALPKDHTDRHQSAAEVQGGYRNVPMKFNGNLLPLLTSAKLTKGS
jgi:hypothetical protein